MQVTINTKPLPSLFWPKLEIGQHFIFQCNYRHPYNVNDVYMRFKDDSFMELSSGQIITHSSECEVIKVTIRKIEISINEHDEGE